MGGKPGARGQRQKCDRSYQQLYPSNNTTSRCTLLSQKGWNTALVQQFVLQHQASLFANRQRHFHYVCHAASLSLFSILTSTKQSITQNPISSEVLQSLQSIATISVQHKEGFPDISVFVATMMMEEWDIVQNIQFLLSASQQIYLAQVTEHIFKPSMTYVRTCKRM